jgi:hypothetical protein
MQRAKTIGVAGGAAGVIAILSYLTFTIITQADYSLEVDAMRDDQSLFINTRIILANTGKLPLTDININYGSKNETINIIGPGEKVALSPPEGSNLNVVKITADNGINITKEYRKPIKLPGMIGS